MFSSIDTFEVVLLTTGVAMKDYQIFKVIILIGYNQE